MNKLNPIKYIENMISHHPKSISLWMTEGIVINGERYIIKEFRLRDGSLYAVIAENKYTPKYFEVKLAPDEETLKDIYQAIKDNKIAIEQEITDRKNEISRVDSAIKANTTKINQEITDRKNEINRVDKKVEANTAKINQEITDRHNEISRVNEAISANTAKINKEITDRQNEISRVDSKIEANTVKIDKEISDRQNDINRVDKAIAANTTKIDKEISDRTNEITRVDEAINANTAKINQEITDRQNEITRVDNAINANTEKINQEITDRTNEINRVDNKITALEDKSTTTDSQIAALDKATKDNKATIDQEIANRRDEINRVDGAIEANTAKIDQEITDRQNEISRVDGAINANTAKINKEIKDRKDEITRVEGKIPTEIGGTNHYAISKDSKTAISSHFTDVKRDVTTGIISAKVTGVYPYFGQAIRTGKTYQEEYGQKIPVIQGKSIAVTFSNSLFNKSYVSYFGSDDVAVKEYRNKDTSRFIVPASDLVGVSYITLRYGLANGTAYVGQTIETKVKVEYDSVYTDWSPAPEDIEFLIAQKQDKLTAGTGIAIQGNVISATGSSAPQHDTQKEQVLASTQNTITITHGTNGTSETTKVDTNPQKVLEHDNLLTDNGISKTTSGNTTKLGLEYRRVDGGRFDLNNLVNGKVRASDFINAPSTGWLFVSSYSEGSYAIQRAIKLDDQYNTVYVRRKREGTWEAWREQVGDKSVIDAAISANTIKINQEIQDRKSEITRVEGKIPTDIGTVNLFKGSRDFSGSNWIGGAGVYVEDYKGVKIFKKQDIWGGRSQYFEVKTGEEYVFSAYVKSSAKTDGVNFYLPHDSKQPKASGIVSFGSDNGQDNVNIGLTDEYKRIAIKIKITSSGWMAPRIERYNSDAYLFFGGYKLERGNVATDWSLAPEDYYSKLSKLEEKVAELQGKAYKKINIETNDYTGYYSVYDGKVIKYDVTAKDGKYLDLRNFTFSDGKGPITGVTFDSNSLSVIYKVQNSLGDITTYDNFAKFSINAQNKIVIDPSSTSQLLRNNLDKVTSFSYVTMDPNYKY